MVAVGIGRFLGGICAAASGVVVAVALAACGHAAHLTHGHELRIAEMEYRLRPDHITVPSGTLTVAVHNFGRLTHDFEVVLPSPVTTVVRNASVTQTGTTTIAARSADVPPGASATVTVKLKAGYRYGIASVVDNDQGEGMQGSLTVTSK